MICPRCQRRECEESRKRCSQCIEIEMAKFKPPAREYIKDEEYQDFNEVDRWEPWDGNRMPDGKYTGLVKYLLRDGGTRIGDPD